MDGHRKRHVVGNQFPRKRAAIACEFCRIRKSRCDNVKPTCGFCRVSGAVCSFAKVDDIETTNHQPEPSPTDLLRRIDYAITLLESQRDQFQVSPSHGFSTSETAVVPAGRFSITPSQSESLPSGNVHQTLHQSSQFGTPLPYATSVELVSGAVEDLESPAASYACELVLGWQPLQGFAPVNLVSFALENKQSSMTPADGGKPDNLSRRLPSESSLRNDRGPNGRTLIDEGCVVELVDRYLAVVHIKNPILDTTKLRQYAAEASEYGFSWDGPTCLVVSAARMRNSRKQANVSRIMKLLACAIATIVTKFDLHDPLSIGRSDDYGSSGQSSSDVRALSDSFFFAARKRLGLLEEHQLGAQCHYLAGIYEMCCLRVLQAWAHYQQAIVHLQVVLSQNAQSSMSIGESTSINQQILERLQFSCLKTENEFRAQIPFNPSGITRVGLLNFLPSPPQIYHNKNRPQNSKQEQIEEQGWFYYTAEISLLRTQNRILNIIHPLYSKDAQWWDLNASKTVTQALGLEHEINMWVKHLPPFISWEEESAASNELAFILRTRTTHLRQALYQPFLFCLLHHQLEDPQSHESVLLLSQKCLQYCAESLNGPQMESQQWRHGGIWFGLRLMFKSAITLLAAVRCNIMGVPEKWRGLVQRARVTLTMWEKESIEIHQMREILDGIIDDTRST